MAAECWLFQANPDEFPILERFEVGATSYWRATRIAGTRRDGRGPEVGDEGVVWVSGGEGGVLGMCEVVAEPATRLDPERPREPEVVRLGLRYTRRFDPLIPRRAVESHPGLVDLPVFRMTRGTVYRLDSGHWTALLDLVRAPSERQAIGELVRGQGFAGSALRRRALEEHAMKRAREYFEPRVDQIEDVSAHRPYDLLARRGGRELHIEVKGTTTSGASVLLTAGEVRDHEGGRVEHALFVVSDIEIVEDAVGVPRARGGRSRVWDPWALGQGGLEPVGYVYATRGGGVAA